MINQRWAGMAGILFFLMAGVGAGRPALAAAAPKIGMVEISRVFDEYQKTKDQDRALEDKQNRKQAEREKMVDEVKKLKEEMELLSEKGREDKQVVYEEKLKKLQDFDRAAGDELRRERDLMGREIFKEITAAIKDLGQKEGFTVVLDERAAIYSDKEVDLTDRILDSLNKSYKPAVKP